MHVEKYVILNLVAQKKEEKDKTDKKDALEQ